MWSENAPEMTSESLTPKKSLGEHAPTPPYIVRVQTTPILYIAPPKFSTFNFCPPLTIFLNEKACACCVQIEKGLVVHVHVHLAHMLIFPSSLTHFVGLCTKWLDSEVLKLAHYHRELNCETSYTINHMYMYMYVPCMSLTVLFGKFSLVFGNELFYCFLVATLMFSFSSLLSILEF